MDRLPQEIYNEIATCVVEAGTRGLARIATVSRAWQLAIERHTWRTLVIKSHDIDDFNRFLAQRHRRRFLRILFFKVRLPTYDYLQRERYESETERRINDEGFTLIMQKLFRSLSSWDPAIDSSLKLRITEITSPSDKRPYEHSDSDGADSDGDPDADSDTGSDAISETFSGKDLGEHYYVYSYVQILTSFNLPLVPVVDSFGLSDFHRKVAHCVPLQLAAFFPNLREAYLRVDDTEDRFPRLRSENRTAMASWIQNVIPNSTELRDLCFSLSRDEESYAARLPDGMVDNLCSSVRESTANLPNLKRLAMEGTLDKTLFWPDTSQTLVAPFWQHLEVLEVNFFASKTSNGWYFNGYKTNPQVLDGSPGLVRASARLPPGYGDDGEPPPQFEEDFGYDEYLTYAMPSCPDSPTPDVAEMDPLLESFANACLQMPNLKQAHLVTSIIINDNPDQVISSWEADWGVWYIAPHEQLRRSTRGICSLVRGTSADRRLFWDVGEWRPSETLQNLFEGIGRDKHDNDMAVEFIDSWNLVVRPRYIEQARLQAAEFFGANLADEEYMEFMLEHDWNFEDTYLMDMLQAQEEAEIREMDAEWGIDLDDLDDLMNDDLATTLNDEIWEGLEGIGGYY